MFNETIIVQPDVPESQPDLSIDYSTNPDYHKCKECQKYLPIATAFYIKADNRVNSNTCKACITNKERAERYEYIQNNCGSEFVNAEPNTYPDEFQRACTFDFMKLLGYLYDEETGIWTKPGWKEIRDGKPYFLKIKKGKQKGKRLTELDKVKITQLWEQGYGLTYITNLMNISETTAYRYGNTKTYKNR